VTLDATTPNATSYQWAGISSNAPVVTIKADGVYYVTVSNSCGSLTESSTVAFNDCDCRIVMPNAFTPNGDGTNDVFGSDFKCDNAKFFDMSIFNRWGERVFQTNDLYGTWDGKYKGVMQEPGVYVYYANFVGLDHGKEKTFKMKGSVTLIR
jgi:gliding motility-associated-like protein